METIFFRRDIQALRGIAVLLVVLHHGKVPPFQGGYLGVDIFFVISGFLITSVVVRGVRNGTFSFADFYWRRARRLLPAAYVTFAGCIVLSPFLLTELEMRDFVKQVFGAVTLSANVVLWLQTGYFELAAELKPLLHTWSLSLEEQYYLLLPATLVFAPRKFWLPGAIALTALSLLLCMIALPFKPGAVFYLLPSRAWELGFGSVLAIWNIDRKPPSAQFSMLGLAALVLIGWIWVVPLGRAHPGIDAFLACAGTAILLAQPHSLLSSGVAARALIWVGDRSYSLYLVHWPLFAFLNSANVGAGGISWHYRLTGIAASLVLASVLYWAVEHRFRIIRGATSARSGVTTLVCCSVLLCAAAAVISNTSRSEAEFGYRLRTNFGLSQDCESTDVFVPKVTCMTARNPRILVWGDSFAMHLMPGIAASSDSPLAQATRSTCAPILGLAIYAPPKQTESWANSCIDFNSAVLRSLSTEYRSVQVVVLSSPWGYLLESPLIVDGELTKHPGSALVVARMKLTIEAIRSQGKRVVLVAPPPGPGFDAGRCNERLDSGLWSFGGTSDCQFDLRGANERLQGIHSFLKDISRESSVGVVTFDDALCSESTNLCVTRWGSTVLYRDVGHLSHEGSVAVAKRIKLGQLIETLAR